MTEMTCMYMGSGLQMPCLVQNSRRRWKNRAWRHHGQLSNVFRKLSSGVRNTVSNSRLILCNEVNGSSGYLCIVEEHSDKSVTFLSSHLKMLMCCLFPSNVLSLSSSVEKEKKSSSSFSFLV